MSLVVISDSSPVNYLRETGYIDVLPGLYGQVTFPTAVQTPASSPRPQSGVHRGEMAAVSLAEELRAGLVLMDDAAGVRYALERGLTITGTLGVLVEAAQNGRVQIDVALSKLKNTDFRATPGLYERARQLAFTKPPVLPRRKEK